MTLCESEENRRKLAWLVPGYILLAWFFCVVFQPLGLTSLPGTGNTNEQNDESLYEIINLHDDPQFLDICSSGRRHTISLSKGRGSGLILRLTGQEHYRYREFNCSLEVVAGPGMDGVTAVVEHMDMRMFQEEAGGAGGHWPDKKCLDYLDVRTEKSISRERLCGKWDIKRDVPLTLSGSKRNIIGYCYEDRSGHSCETKKILIDVSVDHNKTLTSLHPELSKTSRHGFTLVLTAYSHTNPAGDCGEGEMTCPNADGGVHSSTSHCIWQKLLCDGHQNCGFLVNKDEFSCRSMGSTPWSFGTITILVTIWVAIVTVLMLATVFLLQWNRITFRTPLDMMAEMRPRPRTEPAAATANAETTAEAGGHGTVVSQTTTADPRTGGTVSIMVMYRPPAGTRTPGQKTVDLPPTYESLYMAEEGGSSPPGYNMLTVNLPPGQPTDQGGHPGLDEQTSAVAEALASQCIARAVNGAGLQSAQGEVTLNIETNSQMTVPVTPDCGMSNCSSMTSSVLCSHQDHATSQDQGSMPSCHFQEQSCHASHHDPNNMPCHASHQDQGSISCHPGHPCHTNPSCHATHHSCCRTHTDHCMAHHQPHGQAGQEHQEGRQQQQPSKEEYQVPTSPEPALSPAMPLLQDQLLET